MDIPQAVMQAVPMLVNFPQRRFSVEYDDEADVLYISFRRPQAADTSVMTEEGVLLRHRQEELVGVTIHDASARRNTTDPKEETTKSSSRLTENRVAVIALCISIISVVASIIIGYLTYVQPGVIEPLEPSGYAIIRGDGSFPSDMLVLPIEWKNMNGRAALIHRPEIVLHELDADGLETEDAYRFTLAGEYPEISYLAFRERYVFENSFVIAGHSVPVKNLVFHYERWWDENDPLYAFRFTSGKRYRVTIRYQLNDKERVQEHNLFVMPTYERADELQSDRSGSYWDFWYMDTRQ